MHGLIFYSPCCIDSLVPSVGEINVGGPGGLLGGLNPPLILLVAWISSVGFCVPGNRRISADMVNNDI